MMEMNEFSTTLLYRVVPLNKTSDVVRFSFIVHKSISYLDLKPCRKLMGLNNIGITCRCCALKLSNYFVNTEEKCRKYFTASRRLLYNLHLDLPKGRESNLNEDPKHICKYFVDAPHIAKITPTCGFYNKILSGFITEIIENNSKKLHILKWLLKTTVLEKSLLYFLEIEIAKKFIDFFYPTIIVPELFENFIMHLDIIEWATKFEEPEILEYLLYYARHFGRTDLIEEEDFNDIIDTCIIHHLLKNISPFLKYMNAPKIPRNKYFHYPEDILLARPDLNVEEFSKAMKQVKKERMYLIMQLIWLYTMDNQDHSDDGTLESLRLIWCSVPDPYLSFKEIVGIFKEVFSTEELKNIYDFYVRAIGEFYEMIEPRTLQHLCRTVIRRTLRVNEYWIPEGVKQTGLSNKLQSFLNLEKTFVTCNELVL